MTNLATATSNVNENLSFKWERGERTIHLELLKSNLKSKKSLRSYSKESGIPRSTLRDWQKWGVELDADPLVIQFFESSQGLAFLHRLVTGLHLIFVEVGACGIRLVSKFLTLTGLNYFVGSSYDSQRKFNLSVEEAIFKHKEEEVNRLAPLMPKKDISVAKDETFSGGLTLVAIDPKSNYVLFEKKSDTRDATAWSNAMDEAMQGLNCNVIQSTSDEGKGLVSYCENILGAHHSPDIFHVQQELSRAISGPLAALQAEYQQNIETRGPGHPPDFEKQQNELEQALIDSLTQAVDMAYLREQAQLAIKDISKNYHFAQITNGKCYSGEIIGQQLKTSIDTLREIATKENLNESSFDRIDKAERVLPRMVATIDFVHAYTTQHVAKLNLSPKEVYAVQNNLIPSLYLERVAKNKSKAQALPLMDLASQLKKPLFDADGVFSLMDSEKSLKIQKMSEQMANVFQRSSSCVEGRNGVLSFRHHELHRISDRKSKVLTVVHNFFIERSDKTTSAERFFESKPKNFFESILNKVNLPCFPRKPPRKLPQT